MLRSNDDFKVAYIVATDELEPGDLDSPALTRVYNYWDEIRDGLVGPPRQSFRLEKMPAEIIPAMAVVDFLGPPIDYYYRFFGSRMVDIAGQDLTGKRYFADRITGYGFVNAEIFPRMIERRAPICTRTRWVSVKGFEITTTTIRLPLSEDGERITGGVTANRFETRAGG
mgnify:CR=1 FL=1